MVGQFLADMPPILAPAIGARITAGSGAGRPQTLNQSREGLTARKAAPSPDGRSAFVLGATATASPDALPIATVCVGLSQSAAVPGWRRCVCSDQPPDAWQSDTSMLVSMHPIARGPAVVARPVPAATAVHRFVGSNGSMATTSPRVSSRM